MSFPINVKKTFLVVIVQLIVIVLVAQPGVPYTKWTADGNAYYQVERGEIVKIELPSQNKTTVIDKKANPKRQYQAGCSPQLSIVRGRN